MRICEAGLTERSEEGQCIALGRSPERSESILSPRPKCLHGSGGFFLLGDSAENLAGLAVLVAVGVGKVLADIFEPCL
jgi:hypothetical protein